MVTALAIWIGLGALLLVVYFSACHGALKTFNRARLNEALEARNRPDKASLFQDHRLRLVLATGALRACLELVVVLAVLMIVGERLPSWGLWQRYGLALGVAGVLLSAFAVALPSSWAHYRGEALLAVSVPLLRALDWTLRPLVILLERLDPLVRRVSGASEMESNGDQAITEEVLSVVEAHEENGEVAEDQKEMLEAVFEFSSTTVGEIMTPRTDVKGIEVGSSLAEAREAILHDGHSRVPVYEDNLDQIVGVLYVKDLIPYLGVPESTEFELRSILRDALLVPESKPVRDLLADFKAQKVHMAIVLDEYGGTAGLVTIEDILEEIVGEIQDEYEYPEEEPGIRRLDENSVEVDARVEIDDLNDELNLKLPENDDYETVGGFVFASLGHVPEPGEHFSYDTITVTVVEAERTRVQTVRIDFASSEEPVSAGSDSSGPGGENRAA